MNSLGQIYFFASETAIWCAHAVRARVAVKTTLGAAAIAVTVLSSFAGASPAGAAERYYGGSYGHFDRYEMPMIPADPCLRNPTLCEDILIELPKVRACICSDGSTDCCD